MDVADGEKQVDVADGEKHRERWSSRLAFILACIGAAIGFGNVWRFPSLVFDYGGGAFFIPYFLALFIIGIPILLLEIGLGQVYQTGDMGCFSAMHIRLRGVGLSSVGCAYFVVIYYAALIVWTVRAFFESFGNVDWLTNGAEETYRYFNDVIIGMETLADVPWGEQLPTRLVGPNVGYLVLVWVIIYFCIAFGVKVTGRITYFTCAFPVLLLFIFLGKSLTLPGASDGIKAYCGQWDMSVLTTRPDIWTTAVTQIFFSIGVTFGVMTAFGSHCDKNAPAFVNTCIISISDSLFAVIAGFAVFATAGYVAHIQGVDNIGDLNVGGAALLFGLYPAALATLPNGIHWVRLLFFFIFLLGIDSGFALVEGVFTVAHDTVAFRHIKRWKLALFTCTIGCICGLLYVTDAGLHFLDAVDFYINFIMVLVGFFECFAAGWMWELDLQFQDLGKPTVFLYIFGSIAPFVVAPIVWFFVPSSNAMLNGFIALAVIYIACMAGVTFLLRRTMQKNSEWTWKSIIYEIAFRNIFELRARMQETIGYVPFIWSLLIKHIIPQILLVLFINLAAAKNSDGQALFGHYGGYIMFPYQFLGILTVAWTLFILIIGLVYPPIFDFVAIPEDEETEQKMKRKGKEKSIEMADAEVGEIQEGVVEA